MLILIVMLLYLTITTFATPDGYSRFCQESSETFCSQQHSSLFFAIYFKLGMFQTFMLQKKKIKFEHAALFNMAVWSLVFVY